MPQVEIASCLGHLGLSGSGTATGVIADAMAGVVIHHAEGVSEQLDRDEGVFESLWYEHETDDFESAVDAAQAESEDAELQQQLSREAKQTVRTLKLPTQRTLNGKVRNRESHLAADPTVRIRRLRNALTILNDHSP